MKTSIISHAGDIDRALRGKYTTHELLREGKIAIPVRRLTHACIALGLAYGLCMGLFALMRDPATGVQQMAAATLKVPLLFLLTLVVTYPSLYVFSSLAGSRLDAKATLRLLMIAIAVNLAVLAGFGPVTTFFILCTESYAFIKLLNVLMFGIAGLISLAVLRRALNYMFENSAPGTGSPLPDTSSTPPGTSSTPASRTESEQQSKSQGNSPRTTRGPGEHNRARTVFVLWLVVYGVVGAQMGWVLRPFIGSPDLPFEVFRHRESNVFENLLRTIAEFFS